jgi:hypothetical protein
MKAFAKKANFELLTGQFSPTISCHTAAEDLQLPV